LGLAIIFAVGIIIRVIVATRDKFLHSWDERFHALVAKNLIRHPLKPVLIENPLGSFNPDSWCCNSIWLHKQPLFMWQMALSMRLFGINEIGLRLPSILMGAVMILLVYRIALLMTNSIKVALVSAMLMCFSHYQIELISGAQGMDHNDVAFSFYVLISIWSYFEYVRNPKWYFAGLIGLFSGCAILNKWLTGLLIFSVWGVVLLIELIRGKGRNELLHFLLAIGTCVLVFLPWQLYIFSHFPEQARFEFQFNSRHLTEVIEGHSGGLLFYIGNFREYFGGWAWLLLPVGVFCAVRSRLYNRFFVRAGLTYFLIVLLFFSVLVKTKIPTFCYVVAPFALVFIAIGLTALLKPFENTRGIWALVVCFVCFLFLQPMELINSRKTEEYLAATNNARVYRTLKQKLPADCTIVLNANSFENIDVMFYNHSIRAAHWCPSEEDFAAITKDHPKVAVFKERGSYGIPDYIKSYPNLYYIPDDIK
jgi:4-amino-4-deoxy-L-arabinose transferase